MYGASKCAVEGLSDGLRIEVAPLGIMVMEPGPFKTDFFDPSIDVNANDPIEDYRQTAGRRKVRLQNPKDSGTKGWGDLRKAAEVIITAVKMPDSPFRLLPGSTAVRIGEQFVQARDSELRQWASLSARTDAYKPTPCTADSSSVDSGPCRCRIGVQHDVVNLSGTSAHAAA